MLLISPPLLMQFADMIRINAGHTRLEDACEPVLAVLADDALNFAKGTITPKQKERSEKVTPQQLHTVQMC